MPLLSNKELQDQFGALGEWIRERREEAVIREGGTEIDVEQFAPPETLALFSGLFGAIADFGNEYDSVDYITARAAFSGYEEQFKWLENDGLIARRDDLLVFTAAGLAFWGLLWTYLLEIDMLSRQG